MRDVDPLIKFCLYTTDEYLDASDNFGINTEDYVRLAFNTIYRFGEIYDIVKPVYPYYNQTIGYT